jgi:hypothetical protein
VPDPVPDAGFNPAVFGQLWHGVPGWHNDVFRPLKGIADLFEIRHCERSEAISSR